MPSRQRAGQAAAAFGRVGGSPAGELPASDLAGDDASITASGNAGEPAVTEDAISGITTAGGKAGGSASPAAASRAIGLAGGKASRLDGKRRRRVGRPRGPERVPLTVRILTATDERLTAAVEETGTSPQYIVDEALSEYLARLGF
jgi:hypothetical protein